MTQSPVTIIRISEWDMRKMFNDGKYWKRTQSGELTAIVEHNRHPALPLAGEPFCTQRQEVSYYDANNEVAQVHQYKRQDGSLGLKGRPDPQRLFQDGVLYRIEKQSKKAE